jgi:transcriptional regulator GlxA family with amidase domain
MTASGPDVTAPVEIAIVCYPGAQATCIHGLTDLFTYAGYFAGLHAASSEPFVRVTHWRPRDDDFECTFDTLPGDAHAPRVIIVPACQIAPPEKDLSPPSTGWVRKHHADGAIVAAVCGGVFLLADSGLLDGRRATTHWMFAAELRHRFPELRVEPDRLVIDDGDVITAGGVLAWTDLGLGLVERLLGPTVMSSTAHFMLADPPGREQRFYGGFAPRLQHGDKEILAIQHWMQANYPGDCSVNGLAKRAGLGARTFLRRFTQATGLNPGEYHQRLRIARGRELLEFTRDPVEKVAQASGYADAGGFRRTFKRVTGLSPAEYRRKFQRARGDA